MTLKTIGWTIPLTAHIDCSSSSI